MILLILIIASAIKQHLLSSLIYLNDWVQMSFKF
jgi:hypothetical protein